MKVFWSWQSDTPGRTGRHFVKQALLEAIQKLKQLEEVEEPREREIKDELHLDQDRQGVPGSPDLARTIFEKIDQAAVFVADVTPVATIEHSPSQTRPAKRIMNPNVAIELGYALKALTDRRVLMVLNTFYGDRASLPFDLAHKAGPITYSLPPEADKSQIDTARAQLRAVLVDALNAYVDEAIQSSAQLFVEIPRTTSPAFFFAPTSTLAEFGSKEDGDLVEYHFPQSASLYLRVIPTRSLPEPLIKAELLGHVERANIKALSNDLCLHRPNEFGVIAISPRNNQSNELKALTQVFSNGEIWSINCWYLRNRDQPIPGLSLEKSLRDSLAQFLSFVEHDLQIQPPYTIEAGAVGVKGRKLAVYADAIDHFGPIYDDIWQCRLTLSSTDRFAQNAALLKLFESFFRLTGYPRPEKLNGFPP